MNQSSIFANLVSCRNILLSGKLSPSVLICLKEVLGSLDLISVEMTRNVIAFTVDEVIKQIDKSELLSAGMILNLIHNLPLTEQDEGSWDIDYFLSMELVTFLENFKSIKSARTITLFVCDQLSNWTKGIPRRPQ